MNSHLSRINNLRTRFWTAFVNGRDRIGRRVECHLICLSVVAIVLAIVNSYLPDHTFRVLGVRWVTWQWGFRTYAWVAFAGVFALYSWTSKRPFREYCKMWWPELMVVAFWWPSRSLWLSHLPSFISLDMVLLLGTLGHICIVAGFIKLELRKLRKWEPLKRKRDAVGQQVEGFMILLSVASIAVIGMAQLQPDQHAVVPILGMPWVTAVTIFRLFTWSVFLSVFVFFGLTSNRSMWEYCRMWWTSLVICVVWEPMPSSILSEIARVLPPESLLLIGSIAHLLRVCGWSQRRLHHHAHWAALIMVVALFSSATLLLMIVEPQTFPTFMQSFISVWMAALTTGGELKPTTFAGWWVYALNGTASLVIIGIFTREWSNHRLFAHIDKLEQLLELQQKTLAAVEHNQSLSTAILEKILVAETAANGGAEPTGTATT
jgi:hypothetical protein